MAMEDFLLQDDDSAAKFEQSMWMDEHLQQDTNRGVLNQAIDDITSSRVSPFLSVDVEYGMEWYLRAKTELLHTEG